VQIRFVSRQGTNNYHGSVYEYFRRDFLNANTWFNNRDLPPEPATGKAPRAKLKFDNYGFRFGGPIRIPGIFDGATGFFFVNYEEVRQPADVSRQRTILSPSAQQGSSGLQRGGGGAGGQPCFQLAGGNGQTATHGSHHREAAERTSAARRQGGIADLNDPLVQRLSYQGGFSNITRYPQRADRHAAHRNKHRVTATYTLNKLLLRSDTLNNRMSPSRLPIHACRTRSGSRTRGHCVRADVEPRQQPALLRATAEPPCLDRDHSGAVSGSWRTREDGTQHQRRLLRHRAALMNPSGGIAPSAAPGEPADITSVRRPRSRHAASTGCGSHKPQLRRRVQPGRRLVQSHEPGARIDFGINNSDPPSRCSTPPTSREPRHGPRQRAGLYAILTGA